MSKLLRKDVDDDLSDDHSSSCALVTSAVMGLFYGDFID